MSMRDMSETPQNRLLFQSSTLELEKPTLGGSRRNTPNILVALQSKNKYKTVIEERSLNEKILVKSFKLDSVKQLSWQEQARINMAARKKEIRQNYIKTHQLDEPEIKHLEKTRYKELVDERVALMDDHYLSLKMATLDKIESELLENFQDHQIQKFEQKDSEIPIQEYVNAFKSQKTRKDWWLEFQGNIWKDALAYQNDPEVSGGPGAKMHYFQVNQILDFYLYTNFLKSELYLYNFMVDTRNRQWKRALREMSFALRPQQKNQLITFT